jgi:hypothetical protein
MSAIPPNLPSLLPPVTLGRGSKSSGPGSPDVPADPAAPLPDDVSGPSAGDSSDLQAALARIQNQNLASALASIKDLDEARAATQSASQGIRSQPDAAQAAQSGLVPQNVLRLLQD